MQFHELKLYISLYTPVKIENARGNEVCRGEFGFINTKKLYDSASIRTIFTHDEFLIIRLEI